MLSLRDKKRVFIKHPSGNGEKAAEYISFGIHGSSVI